MVTLRRPEVRRHGPPRATALAVGGSVAVVLAGSVAQLVDYGFFGLRIGVLDSSEDGGAFGVVGDVAAAGAAAAAWLVLARGPRPATPAVRALPLLLSFVALDKAVRLHDHIPHYLVVYAPVLVAAFGCTALVGRGLPAPRRRLVALGLVMLAASFALHVVGAQVLAALGAGPHGWADQVKAVVKHGLEVQGWFLALIGLAGSVAGRRPWRGRTGGPAPPR